jgi:hypothetical protein
MKRQKVGILLMQLLFGRYAAAEFLILSDKQQANLVHIVIHAGRGNSLRSSSLEGGLHSYC